MTGTRALPSGGTAPVGSPVRRQVLTGHIDPVGPHWRYVPFEVPHGVGRLTLSFAYDRTASVLDLGLFDPRGHRTGAPDGFRGWSGGARTEVVISRAAATPGYLPGEILPGTWQVLLGPYRVAPRGVDWRVEVACELGPPGPRFVASPAAAAGAQRPGWYRGDLHVHTVYSDGGYLPAEVVAGARAGGLHFIASTEHNTPAAHAVWGAHAGPDLLVVNGQEVTTRHGHCGAVGLPAGGWVDWRHRPRDGRPPGFLPELRAQGALAIANHPFAPAPGTTWEFGLDQVDAIEVWNGATAPAHNEAALAAWDGLLRAGRAVAATGGSDAHRAPEVIGAPQTVVRLPRLTAGELVAALRAGRCYVAAGAAVELCLEARAGVRRAGMGERLRGRPGAAVLVRLRVRGAGEAVATLHHEDGTAHRARVADDGAVVWATRMGAARYVRAEVRRVADGAMVALTNPVWLEAAGADPPRPPCAVRTGPG